MSDPPVSPSADPVLRPWFRLLRGGILLLALGLAGLLFLPGKSPEGHPAPPSAPASPTRGFRDLSAMATLGGGLAAALGWLKIRGGGPARA